MKITRLPKYDAGVTDLITTMIHKTNEAAKLSWRIRCMMLHGAKWRAAKS